MSNDDVLRLVDEVIEEVERQMEQAILKQSNYDGLIAYGGKDAMSRLKRRLCAQAGLPVPSCVRLIRAR
jgi:hypothetical protein